MADNDGMYVANRDVMVPTDYGYMIGFKKDVPMYVPPLAREACLAKGIMPVDGEIPIVKEEEKPQEPIGPERKRQIKAGIKVLMEKNDTNDFTAGGVPKEAALRRDLGFRMNRREISDAFKEVRVELQEAS